MPFGAVTQLLGIANAAVKNAASFGSTVLRLPTGFPVYQAHLVHNQSDMIGPPGGAEWCGTADNEVQHTATLREVSAHDSHFSRRNLSDPPTNDLVYHRGTYYNQIYYLNNEPDAGSFLAHADKGCTCWHPRDRNIDQHVSTCFPNPTATFWETAPAGFDGEDTSCTGGGTPKRIQPEALAYIYLKLKEYTETIMGHGHIFLPPSSANPLFGRPPTSTLQNPDAQYWVDFYNNVHNGLTMGNCTYQSGITTTALKAIQLHHYTGDPSVYSPTPLQAVAGDAAIIRAGIDWYRITYNSGNPLNIDILLSEMGFLWSLETPLRWAGGWPSFRKGLSWWNSYLCWLTRRAPFECNLQGWNISTGHRLHGCIHVPNNAPYTTDAPTSFGAQLGTRNQWCLNTDTMQFGVLYNKQTILINDLAIDQNSPPGGDPYPGTQIYQNSFLTFQNSISWDSKTWRTTPFGACYTVWSMIGSDENAPVDPVHVKDLDVGWVYNTTSGKAAYKNGLFLPAGYSTVFFAVIKNEGNFFEASSGNGVNFKWIRSDGANIYRGHMSMLDFEDSSYYPVDNYFNPDDYPIYTSMVYPVVCWTSVARTLTVELYRGVSGPGIWLSRPIVLPGICSWFITQ